jgi:hypothetical protein
MIVQDLNCIWTEKYPSYPTYWLGMEDIRFCDSNTVLLTVPEKNPSSGNPCIFKGVMDGSTIHSIIKCEPSNVEKNWMPYIDTDTSKKVIYNVNPFQIKSIETNTLETISLNSTLEKDLENYHGSTNGIVYNTHWRLFLIHINKERTYHRWLIYNPTTKEVRVSNPFVFFQYSYIEFPCSLCEYQGVYYISLGVNDDKAYILTVEKEEVNKLFI